MGYSILALSNTSEVEALRRTVERREEGLPKRGTLLGCSPTSVASLGRHRKESLIPLLSRKLSRAFL